MTKHLNTFLLILFNYSHTYGTYVFQTLLVFHKKIDVQSCLLLYHWFCTFVVYYSIGFVRLLLIIVLGEVRNKITDVSKYGSKGKENILAVGNPNT